MRRTTLGFGFTLALATAASCGGEDTGETVVFGAEALVEYDRFVEALTRRGCEREVLCGGQPDLDECISHNPGSDTRYFAQIRAGVEAGRTGIAVRNATAFLAEHIPLSCEPLATDRIEAYELAFFAIFRGSAESGESCWADSDCAGVSICDLTACVFDEDTCCTGICRPFERALEEGEPCLARHCGPELNCSWRTADFDDPTYLCYPALAEGADCSETDPCQEGTACREDDSGTLRCLEGYPRPGERCGATSCGDADHYCGVAGSDPDVRTCIPRVLLGGACSSDLSCVDQATCEANVCVLRPRVGEACDEASFRYCLGTAQCNRDTNQCEPLPAFEPCEASRTAL